MSHLVDVLVLYLYFGLFALWSFGYKLYWYGHHLAPTASVKVAAFTPPLFGYKKLANFEVYSYPGLGSYALFATALLLVAALYLGGRQARVDYGRQAEAMLLVRAPAARRERGRARRHARADRGPAARRPDLAPAGARRRGARPATRSSSLPAITGAIS